MNETVPCLPESAPFTPEQRAYLNGFLAGLFSRAPGPAGSPLPLPSPLPASAPTLVPLSILFGSQTGTAETLAKRLAKEAGKRGFAPTVHDLAKYPTSQLAAERDLLIVTSTYGDGDPPDNAQAFWAYLASAEAAPLPQLRFAVCALGDSNYPKFCAFGRNVDERLEHLGGQRVLPRVDCDVDYDPPFALWMDAALGKLLERGATPDSPGSGVDRGTRQSASSQGEAGVSSPRSSTAPADPGSSRAHPFAAPLLANRKLNGPGSAKDTRHFEFSLESSGLKYEAGDALGVWPKNNPDLADEILGAVGGRGAELVPGRDGQLVAVRDALLEHYDITRIPTAFLEAMARRTNDRELLRLTAPDVNGELTGFLWGREIIDVLLAFPVGTLGPAELVAVLRKLQPRLYSISSSPAAHPGRVHLTTAVVRYESLGRSRQGVCSTFLAERVPAGATVPVFIQPNKHFRPPGDPARPMIMVGPGTGVAPFRAFLHERRARGAGGRNWLFFGDQRAAADFLYRDELETMRAEGTLTRLDTAFSRDQEEKVYVQHRLLEQAKRIFEWLEDGAHFYVCGDAKRMAKDVDEALHQVVVCGGGRTSEEAGAYVQRLRSEQRYQRDVY